MRLLLLWLVLSAAASGETLLQQLLDWQRKSYAPAVVTSGFWEPRGISRYRSTPGIHFGYDIAMPYGAVVYAAWPGVVEAIVPWADGEWGIRVLHPDGTRATYGHVVPRVGVGDEVQAGMVLAAIATDHLDVKMLDSRGLPWDFAGVQGASRSSRKPPTQDPEMLGLQTQLRRLLSQPPAATRSRIASAQWNQLKEQGLVQGSLPVQDEFHGLARRYLQKKGPLPAWSAQDLEALDRLEQHLKGLEYRYELGLLARNDLQAWRQDIELWRKVVRPQGNQGRK